MSVAKHTDRNLFILLFAFSWAFFPPVAGLLGFNSEQPLSTRAAVVEAIGNLGLWSLWLAFLLNALVEWPHGRTQLKVLRVVEVVGAGLVAYLLIAYQFAAPDVTDDRGAASVGVFVTSIGAIGLAYMRTQAKQKTIEQEAHRSWLEAQLHILTAQIGNLDALARQTQQDLAAKPSPPLAPSASRLRRLMIKLLSD